MFKSTTDSEIFTLPSKDPSMIPNAMDEFNFEVNKNNYCMMSSKFNLTLEKKQPISCHLMEGFVLASWTPTCEKMIGYKICKVTNGNEVSGSCDFMCQCKVTNEKPCMVAMVMRAHIQFESIIVKEISLIF